LSAGRAHKGELLPILDQLLIRLSRSSSEAPGRTEASHPAAAPDDWIARVESLVIRSIREGGDLESVARAVGISSRHLRSRFEAATGVSLRDYRSGYQLSRAIALMENTDLRLGEIAELCGFNSQPAFNRFIRRHTGRSPNQVRQRFKAAMPLSLPIEPPAPHQVPRPIQS
jgi:transcriptional regulator GlxA family with amidase domain